MKVFFFEATGAVYNSVRVIMMLSTSGNAEIVATSLGIYRVAIDF